MVIYSSDLESFHKVTLRSAEIEEVAAALDHAARARALAMSSQALKRASRGSSVSRLMRGMSISAKAS